MSDAKTIVLEFYDLTFTQHQPERAALAYLAPDYIQHNPTLASGRQAFIDFFVAHFAQNPALHARVVHVVAEADLVAVHVHSTNGPTDRGVALVDLFRVAGGKIVEHWDVIQPVPETSMNTNTMF